MMALVTPTVAQINNNIIAQIEAAINQTIPLVPKAFNRVLAKALAAVFVLLWKYSGFIFLQIFVKTATIEDVTINGQIVSPLKEWGRLIGVGDPIAAVQAQFTIDITVETQTGSLASGTQLVNSATGVTYLLVGSVDLDAAVVQGLIRAAGDQGGGNGAGAIGNASVGDLISFVNPIANVAKDTAVAATVVTGADAEDTGVYRQRVIDRFKQRPQGGALLDYGIWGGEVAGVADIFPYTGDEAGEVDVFVEGVASSFPPDGIPDQALLDAVAASIELDDEGLASRRPVGSFVNVFAITRTGFNITVLGIVNVDNLADTQTQITAALEEFMLDRAPFISGLTLGPRTDTITNTGLSGVVEDIVTAANGTFDGVSFVLTSGGGNLFIYTLGRGEKAKASNVIFST